MVLKKDSISNQYLQKREINVMILEVKSPSHYIIKESPGVNTSAEAKRFAETEQLMQKYYMSVEEPFTQLPLKDSVVIVLHQSKFYRAQVKSILNLSDGNIIKVYLLDYGFVCNVPRNCIFKMQKDFMDCPVQAVEFKLMNLQPLSLVMDPTDLSFEHKSVSEWDIAAVSYIEDLKRAMYNSHIVVKGFAKNFLFGSLYMTFKNEEVLCVNEELLSKKYATQNVELSCNVTDLDDLSSSCEIAQNCSENTVQINPVDTATQDCSSKQKASKNPVNFLKNYSQILKKQKERSQVLQTSTTDHEEVPCCDATTENTASSPAVNTAAPTEFTDTGHTEMNNNIFGSPPKGMPANSSKNSPQEAKHVSNIKALKGYCQQIKCLREKAKKSISPQKCDRQDNLMSPTKDSTLDLKPSVHTLSLDPVGSTRIDNDEKKVINASACNSISVESTSDNTNVPSKDLSPSELQKPKPKKISQMYSRLYKSKQPSKNLAAEAKTTEALTISTKPGTEEVFESMAAPKVPDFLAETLAEPLVIDDDVMHLALQPKQLVESTGSRSSSGR